MSAGRHEEFDAADATLVERCFADVRGLDRVGHEHLAAVHELRRLPDGRSRIEWAPLDAEPLAERLARGPLAAGAAAQLAGEVLAALAVVHDRGLTHGALTVDRVLITRSGRAKVVGAALGPLRRPEGGGTPADDLRAVGELLRTALGGGDPGPLAPILAQALGGGFASAREMESALAAAARALPLHELAATTPRPGSSDTPAPARVGPYELGAQLGEGGAGRVYRAWDGRLHRHVALKLLRAPDRQVVARLVREARAHARVDHPNVCKIFEVGDAPEGPYIAMQLIDGHTLGVVAPSLPLRERVRLAQQVAHALAALHELGLIHRDVKPSNIMVEQPAGAPAVAYLMDFGLAREVGDSALTESGMVVGTPHYMAPEQARGEVRGLDARADVYALGATLYQLAAGQPPFLGDGTVELMYRVLHDEPTPPRALDAAVPAELQTIVLRCLEKDPARRYPSARALADDLGRWLAGDPIAARPLTLRVRLARAVRRHRLAVTAGALTLLFAAAMAAYAGWARHVASVGAEAAQRFGRAAAQIESTMRNAYLLPLHDTRRERAQVREQMRELAAEMARLGSAVAGPGHLTLGRGHLALGELEPALVELDAAWQLGQHGGDASFALGQTLVALYRGALDDARRGATDAERQSRTVEIERKYRDRAVEFARLSLAERGGASAYLEALLAFAERRWDDGLAGAARARGEAPDSFEAVELEGDLYTQRAYASYLRGDLDAALADHHRAEDAYRSAASIVRSHPLPYRQECANDNDLLRVLEARGQPLADTFERARRACRNAITANPDDAAAYDAACDLNKRRAEDARAHGEDPLPFLNQALADGRAAIQHDPKDPDHYVTLCTVFEVRADHEYAHGVDSTATLQEGEALIRQAIRLDPRRAELYSRLGSVIGTRAQAASVRGVDPTPDLERGVAAYQKAVALEPKHFLALENMGVSRTLIADYQAAHGGDPRPLLAAARGDFERGRALNPARHRPDELVGEDWLFEANYLSAIGDDPTPACEQSALRLRRALEINPRADYVWFSLGDAQRLRALYAVAHGGDPAALLSEAREVTRRSLALTADEPMAWVVAATVELVAAQWAVRQRRSPAAALDAAERFAAGAIKVNPQWPEAEEARAQAFRWRAEAARAQGASPAAALDAGRQAAARALAMRPDFAQAIADQGELALLDARATRNPTRRAAQAAEAVARLERAVALNGNLAHALAADLTAARALAR